ncbi:LCP family protein [Slackia piriformis]|uniref:LCP family protein n=1 Tax=Slackia piriformis TaxID=626934 RepID=UPI0026DC4D10|nr:LCP family protein [Slackia piriformis]MDO5023341.1 LCP family protein [Slackia piriformis]
MLQNDNRGKHIAPTEDSFGSGFRPVSTSSVTHDGFLNGFDLLNSDGLRRVKKKKSKLPKILITVFAVLFALVVCAGIALALWVNSLNESMGFEDEAQKQELMRVLAPSNDGQNAQESSAFYMLILGSDAREGDGASRADVTMLCRIDPDTATVDLVSIPRDTMVEIDGYGTQKINAAYSFGGAAGAVETVSQFAGVDISHYAEVHFEELESVVDELGGIWVNVPEAFQAGNISFDAGEQKLNGEQALAFARERHNVSGGDFGRAQAQRIIVQAIIKQVLNTPPAELPSIVGKLASSVSTDYSVTDLVSLAQTFQGKSLVMYSAVCPSYSLSRDGVSYVATMFDEWRVMMQRVDAGLDPNDTEASIPESQTENERLGAASNSPAPRHYAGLAENAGLTTDDVAPESAGSN